MRSLSLIIMSSLGIITLVFYAFSYANGETGNRLVNISQIDFVGNHQLTSEQLKSQLATKESGSVAIAGSDRPFNRDVQKLNDTYFNAGYVQAKIEQPKIEYTTDGKSARLIFNIKEGDRYKIGKVGFEGNWPSSPSDLFAATQLHKQTYFNYQILQDDLKVLQTKSGAKFYPLPRTRIREAAHEVDVTFELAKKGT